MKSLSLLNFFVAYILLIAILQSYFCIDFKLVGFGFIILGFGALLLNSKKIIVEKSDIVIVMFVVLLNIYYTLIELKGTIFSMPSYILILSILLSKIILPNISLKGYLRRINIIYLILLIGLLVEYLLMVTIGSGIFRESLMCDVPGVQGYRSLHNFTSNILSINVSGLNSIMMGAQTASQLAVIAFTWYLYKYKVQRDSASAWAAFLAIFMFIMSPSITTIILLLIVLGIVYLIYLKDIYQDKVRGLYQLYIFLIISVLIIYFVYEILILRHQSITYIFDELILAHLSGFYDWSSLEVFFGASYMKIHTSFASTEIMFLQQLAMYGIAGVSLFYFSIIYYTLRVLKLRFLMRDERLMLLPSIIIIIIFILGNIHYYVLFQAGVRELFSLHLAYIIYQGSRMKKYTNKAELI